MFDLLHAINPIGLEDVLVEDSIHFIYLFIYTSRITVVERTSGAGRVSIDRTDRVSVVKKLLFHTMGHFSPLGENARLLYSYVTYI